ncbi:hypothetical protein BVRB_6g147200 [Beta vulgaris subsp. vulgaris]|nr:hypothetical protein BVRB_6g147200 [Beta vulgaris subsp. vulgaris]
MKESKSKSEEELDPSCPPPEPLPPAHILSPRLCTRRLSFTPSRSFGELRCT